MPVASGTTSMVINFLVYWVVMLSFDSIAEVLKSSFQEFMDFDLSATGKFTQIIPITCAKFSSTLDWNSFQRSGISSASSAKSVPK